LKSGSGYRIDDVPQGISENRSALVTAIDLVRAKAMTGRKKPAQIMRRPGQSRRPGPCPA